MDQNGQYQQQPQPEQPGKGAATASVVLGILSIIFGGIFGWVFYTAIFGVISGIIGIVLSISAKKAGFTGSMSVAGLVTSIIGLVLSAIFLIACGGAYCALFNLGKALS